MRLIATETSFSGPLPPPEVLSKYDQIVRGAAERILRMAEEQSTHRRHIEAQVISADTKNSQRGLIFGLIIGLAGFAAATIMVLFGQPWAGAFLGLLNLGSLVGVFVYGSASRRRERAEQRKR